MIAVDAEASVGEIVVRLMPLPSDMEKVRVLQLRLSTTSGGTVSSQWLVRGSKKDLDAFLSARATPEAIDVVLRNLEATQRRLELP